MGPEKVPNPALKGQEIENHCPSYNEFIHKISREESDFMDLITLTTVLGTSVQNTN